MSVDYMAIGAAFDAVGFGFAVWRVADPSDDREIFLEVFNNSAERMTGVFLRDAGGKRIDVTFPDARRDGVPQTFARVAATGVSETIDVRHESATGGGLYWSFVFAFDDGLVAAAFENLSLPHGIPEPHNFYSQLLDNVGQAVIATDMAGQILYWNRQAERIYGWSSEETIGRPIVDVLAGPEDIELSRSIMATLLRGESWSGEFDVRRRDGSVFRAYVVDAPIRRRDQLVGIVGVSMDMTETLEREERQRALLEALPDPIMRFDREGTITDCSQRLPSSQFQSRDEVIGRSIAEVFPTEAVRTLAAARKAATGGMQTFEFSAGTEEKPLTYEMRVVTSGKHESVAVIRDVTAVHLHQEILGSVNLLLEERVKERTAELAQANAILRDHIVRRERAEHALRETTERLQLLIDSSPAAILQTDREGRVLLWNAMAERLFGWTAEEVLGKVSPAVPPERLAELRGILDVVFRGARIEGMVLERISRSGHRLSVRSHFSPVFDAEGNVESAMVITTSEEASASTPEAIARLTNALAAVNRVAKTVSTSLDLETVVATARNEFESRLGVPTGVVLLSDDDEGVQFHSGWGAEPDVSTLTAAIRTDSRAATSPAMIELDSTTGATLWTAAIVIPLVYQSRRSGVLALATNTRDRFSPDELDIFRTLARELTMAVANAQLFASAVDAKAKLQRVSRHLLDVQEEERRHLGRELHDQIGQMLTGLTLLIESGRHHEAQQVVGSLMQQVRTLSVDLRPPMLEEGGLIAALRSHAERFSAVTNLQIELRHDGTERFPAPIETAAFRVAQEALTNVARHAMANRVVVNLWTTANALMLQVTDDGIGFDPRTTNSGAGLSVMRERAMLLGGSMFIEAAPGSGTRLTVELPIAPP
ncbi:MAG TPA: PAS domain S-box protein [Thermoanaerobaculia bacterium]|nr:PAS domain S-box protein [Thermoanaerobaculia bacterium]